MIICLVLFSLLSFHFIFIFYSPTSFTFTLPILFDLYYICCFISCLFYCIYYYFILLFILHNPLSQKCRVKTNRLIHFSSRHIWKHVLLFLFLFWLLLFKETCFKFYLIAVLICYLHFIIHCRAHNAFGTLEQCLSWPSLLQVALNLARNEAWVITETLCSLRWCFGVYSTFNESCIINFKLF